MKTFKFKIAALGLINIFSLNSCSKNSAFQLPAIKILGTLKIENTYNVNSQNNYGPNCAIVSAINNT